MSPQEIRARQDLACVYRIFDAFGWHELIYNHITVRVPGEPRHFLINQFGLMYREIRASNLVKIDVDGRVVDGSTARINPAGFIVHSAVHSARPDAHAVIHTHTTAGQVVACQADGLLPLSFTSAFFHESLAYHDFEGITLEREECARLARDLGDKKAMILRNHGLLTCASTLAEAFALHYHLQRACEVQAQASAGNQKLLYMAPEVAKIAAAQYAKASTSNEESALLFDAMKRWMYERDASYLD